jgi:hypothetical protein
LTTKGAEPNMNFRTLGAFVSLGEPPDESRVTNC